MTYDNISKFEEWFNVNEKELHTEYCDVGNDFFLHYDKPLPYGFEAYCVDRFNNKETK